MMRRLLFFTCLLILTTLNAVAQKWIVTKQYKDEWGDPDGRRLIEQIVESTYGLDEEIIIVKISRVIPSDNYFQVICLKLNGNIYEYYDLDQVRAENGPSDRVLRKNPNMDPANSQGARVTENKYLLKYKIGDTESSFYITGPRGRVGHFIFEVDCPKLDAILQSASEPVKCIIAKEIAYSGEVRNLFNFRLYPSNYKQFVH